MLQARGSNFRRDFLFVLVGGAFSLALAIWVLGLVNWDLTIPLIYTNADDIWQLVLTKVVAQTGWVLDNPYLGAPGYASWHHNSAAQTSALHSVLMLVLSTVVHNPVEVQQVYYLANFPLITATTYAAARLLSIGRLPAICAGVLFAFTTFRIDAMFYAFLANYFMVPLALVPIFWTLMGTFREQSEITKHRHWGASLVASRHFGLGLAFVSLMAVSDGYYTFFTLLLLGFAVFGRLLVGDFRRPGSLVPPLVYIAAIFIISFALSFPLSAYKKDHQDEFFPNGVEEPVFVKHPFEAEVYSTSLKLLLAPIPYHHIEPLAVVGRKMVATSDAARQFKQGRSFVPLGTLGSLILVFSLICLSFPIFFRRFSISLKRQHPEASSQVSAFLSVIAFTFLCAIAGGLGTLIALFFPTRRAYDRFALFTLATLLFLGGYLFTLAIKGRSFLPRQALIGLLVSVTALAFYDQVPSNSAKGTASTSATFLAERSFVQQVERELPKGAMVYQYPHSQYLMNSPYYGWGSFSHVRLYLHSQDLRWSNGGAKNSPVENWHLFVAAMPFDQLLNELSGVGFSGIVIDRTVVQQPEYDAVVRALQARGLAVRTDDSSNLAFVHLPNSGYRLEYDAKYLNLARLVVTDVVKLDTKHMSALVNPESLRQVIADHFADQKSFAIDATTYPDVFRTGARLRAGMGIDAFSSSSDMAGTVACDISSGGAAAKPEDSIEVTITNQNAFDLVLGKGNFPISLGFHAYTSDGHTVQWDNGKRWARLDGNAQSAIRAGESASLTIPIAEFKLDTLDRSAALIGLSLVQDGNVWFEQVGCRIPLDR